MSLKLDFLESSMETTRGWLREMNDLMHWDDARKSYEGIRAVLHVLRDRLPATEAAHLGAQLPLIIRGTYYEGWKPSATPMKIRSEQEFYDRVAKVFAADPNADPVRLTSCVFEVIAHHVTAGEVSDVADNLPGEIAAVLRKRLAA
jgi:uncharacterized protein (DUF2267 family)